MYAAQAEDWAGGRPDPMVTTAFLQTLRQASAKEAAVAVVTHLNQGVSANSLWDAILLAASELLCVGADDPYGQLVHSGR